MKICGLQKTTLLDFPGHVAATIFIGGCNFRCPFCHNSELLDGSAEEFISMNELKKHLIKRSSILEGVCITGGEPTLFPEELEALIRDIRSMGLLIKLDTNGYRPQVLKHLCRQGLLDYVAMDIKTSRENYARVAGINSVDISKIEESAAFLIEGTVPYEFRTTVVRELHQLSDFVSIGHWLNGAGAYFLQNYVESDQVLSPGFHDCTKDELLAFAAEVAPYIAQVSLRGIDY